MDVCVLCEEKISGDFARSFHNVTICPNCWIDAYHIDKIGHDLWLSLKQYDRETYTAYETDLSTKAFNNWINNVRRVMASRG